MITEAGSIIFHPVAIGFKSRIAVDFYNEGI
jgi:hypothetical protein